MKIWFLGSVRQLLGPLGAFDGLRMALHGLAEMGQASQELGVVVRVAIWALCQTTKAPTVGLTHET